MKRNAIRTAAALLALAVAGGAVMAQTNIGEERAKLTSDAMLLLAKGDEAGLAARMAETGEPLVVCQRYTELALDLYWKEKNVPALVTVSRQGIDYCGTAAKSADRDTALGLTGWRKTLAYNLGSFTWPGWAEKGVRIAPEHGAAGLDAARLNLRLTFELQKPAAKLADAHWLLGAQLLAAKDYPAAEREFEQAKALAADTGDEDGKARVWMNDGWAGVAILLHGDEVAGKRRIENAKQKLMALGEDGKFFAEQYEPALRVFPRDSIPNRPGAQP